MRLLEPDEKMIRTNPLEGGGTPPWQNGPEPRDLPCDAWNPHDAGGNRGYVRRRRYRCLRDRRRRRRQRPSLAAFPESASVGRSRRGGRRRMSPVRLSAACNKPLWHSTLHRSDILGYHQYSGGGRHRAGFLSSGGHLFRRPWPDLHDCRSQTPTGVPLLRAQQPRDRDSLANSPFHRVPCSGMPLLLLEVRPLPKSVTVRFARDFMNLTSLSSKFKTVKNEASF
jgi:hypothetical protein